MTYAQYLHDMAFWSGFGMAGWLLITTTVGAMTLDGIVARLFWVTSIVCLMFVAFGALGMTGTAVGYWLQTTAAS